MDAKLARACADHTASEGITDRVTVGIPLRTGTHHTIALLRRGPDGDYAEISREGYRTRFGDLEVEVGTIIYQRTTSPSSAETLERYGT